jgi:diacylglycerol kinase (ATP)
LKEIFLYKPKLYTIKSKNGEVALEAFLITVANAGQWGNNVYIAPQAKLDDGKLDLIAIKKFSLFSIPNIVFYLANKKINLSKHAFVLYGDSFIIETEEVVNFHCDGEPIAGEKSLEFRIDSRKLKVVC